MARSDPRRRDRQEGDCRCLPIAEWPAPDASTWAAALEPGEVLEPGGPAAHWSLASRRKTSNGYGRFLGWLDNIGNLDPACACPTERVTQQQAAAYVDHLLARNRGYTVLCRVQELYDAIRVMAPERDWTWLRKMGSAIRSRTRPAKSKQGRIQPPHRLAELGAELMAGADAATDLTLLQRAVLFRDGLMIAFLAYRPLRISNLAAMVIGRHLDRQGSRYWLRFEAAEMKNRRILEAAFPTDLLPGLERYLEHYRKILLTGGNRRAPAITDALWISETATAMAVISIHNRFRRHTKAAFGVAMSPHLVRDCAATAMAIDEPEHVRAIMAILGHSTQAISEKHYNQARCREASRRHMKVIADLKRGFAKKRSS